MADASMGNIALCILPTASLSTITGLTSTVDQDDGLIVGAGSTGDGGSGIELPETERIGLELARLSSSAVASSFLREELSSLKLTFPLAGPRNTAPNPITDDTPFSLITHFPGLDALFRSAGLAGSGWSGGNGWNHLIAAPSSAAMAVYFGGIKVVYQEVYSTLKFTLTPGEAGLVEASFSASSATWSTQALTTINPYTTAQGAGTGQSVAAPIVQNAANAWGTTRPFTALEVNINPNLTKSPDSNASGGIRTASEAIDVSFKTTIYANDDGSATYDELAYERTQAISTTAPTADMTFSVGSATANGGVVNSYVFNLNNVTPTKYKPVKIGTYLGWDVEGTCNAISSAATEFALLFR